MKDGMQHGTVGDMMQERGGGGLAPVSPAGRNANPPGTNQAYEG